MKELKELDKWKGKYLRYTYKSYDKEYLKEKLHKACKVIDAYNSNNDSGFIVGHSIRETGFLALGSTKKIHYTLDIIIEPNEQHQCKENINQQKGDL